MISLSIKYILSLMMALNERYPNAWHMLIVRLYIKNIYKSGVQVSNMVLKRPLSKEQKFLIK